MKAILTTIISVAAVIGGAVTGDFLKSKGEAAPAHSDDAGYDKKSKKSDDSKGKKKKSDKKKHDGKSKKKDKKKSGHGDKSKGYGGDSAIGSISYLKFKRQFVVPVVDAGKVESLVILNLNLELNSDAPEDIYNYEPKFRDAFMKVLMRLSSSGRFGFDITSPENYEMVRESLLEASHNVLEYGVEDVLILDLSRQDQ